MRMRPLPRIRWCEGARRRIVALSPPASKENIMSFQTPKTSRFDDLLYRAAVFVPVSLLFMASLFG